jgi:hypothetical protein
MRRWMGFVLLTLIGTVAAAAVERNYDETFDFSAVQSFAWVEAPGWKVNPVADKRIRSAVEARLSAKGYSLAEAGEADLLLDYRAAVRDRLRMDEVWRGRRFRGPSVSVWDVTSYAEGTLLLDMLNSNGDELVWRGIVTGAISPETAEKRIQKAVAKLLKKFPPAE